MPNFIGSSYVSPRLDGGMIDSQRQNFSLDNRFEGPASNLSPRLLSTQGDIEFDKLAVESSRYNDKNRLQGYDSIKRPI